MAKGTGAKKVNAKKVAKAVEDKTFGSLFGWKVFIMLEMENVSLVGRNWSVKSTKKLIFAFIWRPIIGMKNKGGKKNQAVAKQMASTLAGNQRVRRKA